MRLEVILFNEGIKSIPLNYQYYLTSAIYKALGESDKEIAEKIHDEGFGDKKGFKFFTYSFLKGDIFKVKDNDLYMEEGIFKWFISSPIHTLIKMISESFSKNGFVEIKHDTFKIESLSFKGNPSFKKEEKFICNSPIVVTKQDPNGRVEYLVSVDDEFNVRINNNLARKYEILFGEKYEGDGVKVISDKKYPITKLIKFKNIKIKGIYDNLKIVGDTDLIHIAYDTGLGEKNSMGFGMIEKIRR